MSRITSFKMGIYKNTKGQTLIETAIVLVILLLILFGIAEFARAWYIKGSLKNAVRQGVRVAVVTSNITNASNVQCGSFTCPYTVTPPDTNGVINSVCCSQGVPRNADASKDTKVSLTCDPSSPCSNGYTVKVSATTNFKLAVSSTFFPWLHNIPLTTDASMMYEV